MNNQNNSYNQRKQPSVGYGFGLVLIPLLIYQAIAFVIQIIYSFFLSAQILLDLRDEVPEINAIFEQATSQDGVTTDISTLLTPEIMNQITEQYLEVVMSHLTTITLVTSLASIPVFIWYMNRDRKKNIAAVMVKKSGVLTSEYVAIVVGLIALCIALNNLITLSDLAEFSISYQETSEAFYSVSFPIQILALGIVAPIAEEILYRGLIYRRVRRFMTPIASMILSAVVFAVVHGNLVQTLYAGMCGLVFAWLYEKYGTLLVPILAHIVMNITSVILTQYDIFIWIFEEPIRVGIITVVGTAIATSCYVFLNEKNKPIIDVKI